MTYKDGVYTYTLIRHVRTQDEYPINVLAIVALVLVADARDNNRAAVSSRIASSS